MTVRRLKEFLRDSHGATAVEYGVMAGGIALAIVTAVASLSSAVVQNFSSIAAAFDSV